jgi:hypothetical protein
MYSTQAYIYQQLTRVLSIDTVDGESFTYRYDPVYAKRLTINKGVDNVLLFEFINQEEKPVNITGSSFLFRVINTESNTLLIEKPMVILNATSGRAKVTLSSSELLEILAQPASYSIQRSSGNLIEAVFTNAQAGARAPVDIVDSVLPQYVPSAPLTIPTLALSSQYSVDGSGFGAGYNNSYGYQNWATPNGANYWNSYLNPEFHTSFIEPRNAVTTIQMDLVGYSGTIKAQAAENYQSVWYNVTESTTYYNETRTIYMNVIGWYPLIRLSFDSSLYSVPNYSMHQPALAVATVIDGVIQSIQMTNNGTGYLSKPHITIIGNGSGAIAEAVWNEQDGSVTAINVINGGSGYWIVPNQGIMGPQGVPVSPQNQGAMVAISTGYVENLLYR